MNTRTLPTVNRLAVLLALPVAALVAGCGAGADPEPPSAPAAITTDINAVPSVADPLSVPDATSGASAAPFPAPVEAGFAGSPVVGADTAGTVTDLDRLDADLAELDAYLSEADHDLATPEGDLQ